MGYDTESPKDDSPTDVESDYSYSYQLNKDIYGTRDDFPETVYKDLEKQPIPDYASMETFRNVIDLGGDENETEIRMETDFGDYESDIIDVIHYDAATETQPDEVSKDLQYFTDASIIDPNETVLKKHDNDEFATQFITDVETEVDAAEGPSRFDYVTTIGTDEAPYFKSRFGMVTQPDSLRSRYKPLQYDYNYDRPQHLSRGDLMRYPEGPHARRCPYRNQGDWNPKHAPYPKPRDELGYPVKRSFKSQRLSEEQQMQQQNIPTTSTPIHEFKEKRPTQFQPDYLQQNQHELSQFPPDNLQKFTKQEAPLSQEFSQISKAQRPSIQTSQYRTDSLAKYASTSHERRLPNIPPQQSPIKKSDLSPSIQSPFASTYDSTSPHYPKSQEQRLSQVSPRRQSPIKHDSKDIQPQGSSKSQYFAPESSIQYKPLPEVDNPSESKRHHEYKDVTSQYKSASKSLSKSLLDTLKQSIPTSKPFVKSRPLIEEDKSDLIPLLEIEDEGGGDTKICEPYKTTICVRCGKRRKICTCRPHTAQKKLLDNIPPLDLTSLEELPEPPQIKPKYEQKLCKYCYQPYNRCYCIKECAKAIDSGTNLPLIPTVKRSYTARSAESTPRTLTDFNVKYCIDNEIERPEGNIRTRANIEMFQPRGSARHKTKICQTFIDRRHPQNTKQVTFHPCICHADETKIVEKEPRSQSFSQNKNVAEEMKPEVKQDSSSMQKSTQMSGMSRINEGLNERSTSGMRKESSGNGQQQQNESEIKSKTTLGSKQENVSGSIKQVPLVNIVTEINEDSGSYNSTNTSLVNQPPTIKTSTYKNKVQNYYKSLNSSTSSLVGGKATGRTDEDLKKVNEF